MVLMVLCGCVYLFLLRIPMIKRLILSLHLLPAIVFYCSHREVYVEFYRYWSPPAFKVKSEKKRLSCGKDPKDRYGADGHARKSQRMVRFRVSSTIYMYVIMRLNLNYRPSGIAL
jgi:hypothetical protein